MPRCYNKTDKTDWLFRYFNSRKEQHRLEERIEIAMAAACRITPSYNGMPNGGGVSDKVCRAVESIDELRSKLDVQRKLGEEYLNELLKALAHLPENRYEVLRVRFMYGTKWENIAQCQGYDVSTVKDYYSDFIKAFEIPI